MPFARPTLTQLQERTLADIEAGLPGADARLRRSNLNVLAAAAAAAGLGLYGYLDFIAKQVIVDTAEAEFLVRHAGVYTIARKAATFAAGSVTFTGVDTSIIPAGSEVTRSDGVAFTTDAQVAIVAGTAAAAVTASEPGKAGDTAAASLLDLSTTIQGVAATATVAAGGLSGGGDTESDADLLARLLARIRQAPHGGADFDYIAWALEVAEVTRAWVFPNELGLGTVTVRFVVDNHAVSIIPDAPKVAELQAYIDARRPVTAAVTVVAPVAVPLAFTIQLTPNTAEAQAAVLAELTDLILREAAPGGTILLSHMREAVSIAAGETDHVLTVPAANDVRAAGEIATMGVITWV